MFFMLHHRAEFRSRQRLPADFSGPALPGHRRGALGAFYLEIDGTNRSPKVKRLQ